MVSIRHNRCSKQVYDENKISRPHQAPRAVTCVFMRGYVGGGFSCVLSTPTNILLSKVSDKQIKRTYLYKTLSHYL